MQPSPSVTIVPAIVRVVDVERQEAAEPPEVAPGGFHQPSRPRSGLEPLEVEHHLDRPAVVLAEVHDPIRPDTGHRRREQAR